jgi:hypothetical protein
MNAFNRPNPLARNSDDEFSMVFKRHIFGIIITIALGAVAIGALIVTGFMSYQAQSWDALVNGAVIAGICFVLGLLNIMMMFFNFLKLKD